MKNSFRVLVAFLGLAFPVLACSLPPPSPADPASTQAADARPMASPTFTYPSPQPASPTWTPTPTVAPSATPHPVEGEPQGNGTIVIRDPVYGYQFVLPAGWTWSPKEPTSMFNYRMSASYAGIGLTVQVDPGTMNLTYALERRVGVIDHGLGCDVQRQGITINALNSRVAFLEYTGRQENNLCTAAVHRYHTFFISDSGLVEFKFSGSIDSARGTIIAIQDSIQLYSP